MSTIVSLDNETGEMILATEWKQSWQRFYWSLTWNLSVGRVQRMRKSARDPTSFGVSGAGVVFPRFSFTCRYRSLSTLMVSTNPWILLYLSLAFNVTPFPYFCFVARSIQFLKLIFDGNIFIADFWTIFSIHCSTLVEFTLFSRCYLIHLLASLSLSLRTFCTFIVVP